MKTLYGICKKFTTALYYVDTVAVCIMIVLVCVDVLLRKVFQISMVGVTEITQMMWICMILGWGSSVYGPDNLKLDLMVDRFPAKARNIIDSVVTVIMIAACILFAKEIFSNAAFYAEKGTKFSLLKLPQYPFIVVIGIGIIGGAVGLVSRLLLYIGELRGQEWVKEEGGKTK